MGEHISEIGSGMDLGHLARVSDLGTILASLVGYITHVLTRSEKTGSREGESNGLLVGPTSITQFSSFCSISKNKQVREIKNVINYIHKLVIIIILVFFSF